MSKLILRGSGGSDTELSLDDHPSVTIGRSPECEIPIDDTQASRRHCTVARAGDGYEVSDLGSTNGTLVNSTLIKKQALSHGDVIRIGAVEIVYSDPDAVGRAPAGGAQNCLLVFAKGERKGDKLELTEQRTTIGRKESNTVAIKDTVASSYHCEIVRDLNGYVIRDLGSTNGTLVNNEMVTEAQLAHGARIRVGNTRFVFQDPAMAEIDLELAGVDDDESEWGMMRELDLAAVRRRNPATIVYSVLFLALVGGFFYLTTLERGKGESGPQAPGGNLHAPYSFETEASIYAWDSVKPGAVTTHWATSPKGDGDHSLEIRGVADEATVFYGDSLGGRNRRLRLQGKIAARGTKARVGLYWTGLGLERWVDSGAISEGGMQEFDITSSSPSWATAVRIGIEMEGRGKVFLDDVSLRPTGAPAVESAEQDDFRLHVVDGRYADLSSFGAPILSHGVPVARNAAGRPVDASGLRIALSTEADGDEKFIVVTLSGSAEGATVAGVEFVEEKGFLSRGGFRAFTPEAKVKFHAAFPDEGELALSGARKLLLGAAARAFAVLPASADARLHTIARVEGRRRTWAALAALEGGSARIRVKTNLRGEAALASARMGQALTLYQDKRWGEFLELAGSTLAEFPFMTDSVKRQLRERIQTINGEYGTLRTEARRMLRDYEEFRDLASLDRVATILKDFRARFQIKPGEGSRGETYAELARKEATLREAAERKRQSVLAQQLLEQAQYIHLEQGEIYSAAVLLSHIAWYLPRSEQAPQARKLLDTLKKEHPGVLKTLSNLSVGG